jgi:Amt family ammonium transporter
MTINTGDTAWVLISAALVFFMVPGLALFYGGLVRTKNVVATMVQSIVALGVISILWVTVGYSLVFGDHRGGILGGFGHVMLHNVGATPNTYAPHIPALAFMLFQLMFAVITPALIAGAFAERMRFRGYLVFITLWSLVVYVPFAHAVWGGGFLGAGGLGAIDFAGGAVVHETAGAAALAAALYLGPRRNAITRPYNVPMVLLGAGILWFGWFGFNGGSALSAGHVAVSAVVNTQLGAAAGMLAWMLIEWRRKHKPSGIGIATGAIAGLAAITPASGYVPTWAALLIGGAAGLTCYGAVQLKKHWHYDDALDVVGVHMVAGFIGVVLTGVFASLAVNAAGANGGWDQLGRQAVLAGIGLAYPFLATWLVLWLTDRLVGLRVSAEEEEVGLDLSELLATGSEPQPRPSEGMPPAPEPVSDSDTANIHELLADEPVQLR